MKTRAQALATTAVLGVVLTACSSPTPDPARARCMQQIDSFYRLTGDPAFLEQGYANRAFDAVMTLADQEKASKDSFCALLRQKAAEIQQQRAARAATTAEVQAAITDLRTVAHPMPTASNYPARQPADSADAAAERRPDAGGRGQPDARRAPPPTRSVPPPRPATTYCQWTRMQGARLVKFWQCTDLAPAEAQTVCETRLQSDGVAGGSCFCSNDPSFVAGKCG